MRPYCTPLEVGVNRIKIRGKESRVKIINYQIVRQALNPIEMKISRLCSRVVARVKGPDKQIQSGCSKKKFFAVYFSHLPVVSYKSFGLRKKFSLLLECLKKLGTFSLHESVWST
jgi:hypothetical protein